MYHRTGFEEEIATILVELHYTSPQIDCYLVLLQEGPMLVSQLAKRLSLNRTNTYQILNKLLLEKFIWEQKIPQGKLLHASSYKQFQTILSAKTENFITYTKQIEKSIPIFQSYLLKDSVNAPRIRYFNDRKGLEMIINEILHDTTKEICLFTNQESEQKYFSRDLHTQFIKRRIAKNIQIKVLAVGNEAGKQLRTTDNHSLRQTKLLPDSFSFASEIYLFHDKVVLIDIEEEIIGIFLESVELFNVHKQLFDFFWSSLE